MAAQPWGILLGGLYAVGPSSGQGVAVSRVREPARNDLNARRNYPPAKQLQRDIPLEGGRNVQCLSERQDLGTGDDTRGRLLGGGVDVSCYDFVK
jgi:hypothetical protein